MSLQKRAKLVQELQEIQKSLAVAGFHKDAFLLGIKINEHRKSVAAEYVGVPTSLLEDAVSPIPALVEETAAHAAIVPISATMQKYLKYAVSYDGSNKKQVIAKLRTAVAQLPNLKRVASTLSDKE